MNSHITEIDEQIAKLQAEKQKLLVEKQIIENQDYYDYHYHKGNVKEVGIQPFDDFTTYEKYNHVVKYNEIFTNNSNPPSLDKFGVWQVSDEDGFSMTRLLQGRLKDVIYFAALSPSFDKVYCHISELQVSKFLG